MLVESFRGVRLVVRLAVDHLPATAHGVIARYAVGTSDRQVTGAMSYRVASQC